MASLCGRILLQGSRRSFLYSRAKYSSKTLPGVLELATGLEKRELLAYQSGNLDPFNLKTIERGAGTKDDPSLVPSCFNSRLVGCICEEDATTVAWMWLHEGSPRRCECGHWFKLVKKPPI